MWANTVWRLHASTGARTWAAASRGCRTAQWSVLRSILLRNSSSHFGQQYNFDAIDSVRAFQQSVPITTYDDVHALINRIGAGDQHVLTADRVRRFGVTSGSTSAAKLIPYTNQLLLDIQRGVSPWVARTLKRYKALRKGKAYWAVVPPSIPERRSSGGLPIGFDDNSDYLGPVGKWAMRSTMAVPGELSRIRDLDAFRYATLKLLVREPDLTWMSVWSPSFLLVLLQPLREWGDRLITDIRAGRVSLAIDGSTPLIPDYARASELESILSSWKSRPALAPNENGHTLYEAIWPNLALISCWANAGAAQHVPTLKQMFPRAVIEPKGVVATEAFVSFPWDGDTSALAIASHFFEFEEADEPHRIRLAHELVEGTRYTVIVTTSGGLYRYRLGDVVEMVGRERECPLIRLIGRLENVADLCGEKLNEDHVRDSIEAILAVRYKQPTFWMLAPEIQPEARPFYTLFVQWPRDAHATEIWNGVSLAEEVERNLNDNFNYGYARRLGQLDGVAVFVIDPESDAAKTYQQRCVDLGQRVEDIKPTALHSAPNWSEHFAGRFVGDSDEPVPAPVAAAAETLPGAFEYEDEEA